MWQKQASTIKAAFDFLCDGAPSMARALQLKQMMAEGLAPYKNIFRTIKKPTSQAEITVYFHKFTWSVPASRASATPQTVRAACPPPSSSTHSL